MPLAYVSAPPDAQQTIDTLDRLLFQSGWSPVRSPAMINDDVHQQAYHPSPQLVDACLEALKRADILVSAGQWRSCELCRIEYNFARDNNILRVQSTTNQLNIPDAETFGEKYMTVDIHHNYLHAHPASCRP